MDDYQIKTKVLEVTGEPILHGGQESFIFNFIDHLKKDNIQIDLLTPYYCENNNYKEKIKKTGEIFELGYEFAPGKSRRKLVKPFTRFLKEHRYDVVHIHSGSISLLAYFAHAAKICGVKKVIVHSHSMGIESIKHRIIRAVYAPLMQSSATYFLACSYEAGRWKFSNQICKNKLIIVKNAIALSRFRFNDEVRQAIRAEYGIGEGIFVVGHVGRFSYEKNHSFLLDVFRDFQQKYCNSVLMFVGDGDLFNDIKKKSEQMGIQDKVIFVGNVNNVYDYYNAMDIFCLPSLFEGFPIVSVEAQASGLSVLMSDTISNEAVLSSAVEILPITSANVWSEALLRKVPEERKDLIPYLEKEHFDIHDTVETLLDIYEA